MDRLPISAGASLLTVCLALGASYPMGPVYAKTTTAKTSKKSKTVTVAAETSKVAKITKAQDKFSHKADQILVNANGLDKQVLELALVAHGNAKLKGQTNKNVLTVVDYSMPSSQKRMWVINLSNNQIIFHDYVAHGVNSGGKYTTNFSNVPGSKASSFGVFLTASTYQGQHGYSLRLDGLERNLNDNARRRAVVMHGGSYVSKTAINMIGRLGRSWGCFTLRQQMTKPVIDTIRHKTVIFAYYPNFKWLATSKYLNKKALI